MELTLTLQSPNQVAVTCDGQPSHTFELAALIPDKNIPDRPPHPLEDPVVYGQTLYQAIFPADSLTLRNLSAEMDRLLLVIADADATQRASYTALQSIPWEYTHNGEDFLVLELLFVRGLPQKNRIPPPELGTTPAHIVAVPSNPLGENILPLNIAGEWQRLREIVAEIPQQITLEGVNPATLFCRQWGLYLIAFQAASIIT